MDEAEGQGGGERRGINFVRRRILLRANNLEAGTASSELFIAEDTVRSSPIIRLSSRLCILEDPSIKYSLGIMGNRRKMAVVIIYIYIFSIRREKDSLDIYHNLEIRKFVRTLTFKKKRRKIFINHTLHSEFSALHSSFFHRAQEGGKDHAATALIHDL